MERGTGIVRRVDDLGRIVIPRDIRRKLGISEGAPMELFIGENGEVIFKKYMVGETLECAVRNLKDIFLSVKDDIDPDKWGNIKTAIKYMEDAVHGLE